MNGFLVAVQLITTSRGWHRAEGALNTKEEKINLNHSLSLLAIRERMCQLN